MRPKLKPPGTDRLKLKCDVVLSTSGFKFNLRRYTLAAAFCLMVYSEAKLTLLRHSKRPPPYDAAMADIFVGIMPWASVFKICIAGWMLSYTGVPTYIYQITILDDLLAPTGKDTGVPSGDQFNLNERLDRGNAAVSVVVLFFMVVAYVVYRNWMAIRHAVKVGRCSLNLCKPCLQHLELSALKLKYDEALSSFALKFKLRRYMANLFPDLNIIGSDEFSMTPDLSIARSDQILKVGWCRLTL
jgi:hypothetical protein